ncbi:MAG: PKD domain-containing protein, partial [Acidobacteriota bacterium]
WDFGNGSTGSGRTTRAFFSEPGSYRVELFVRDNEGRSASTFRTVNVFGGDCDGGGLGGSTICIQ